MKIKELRDGLVLDLVENAYLSYWFGEEGIHMLVDALDKQMWIPVSERLPEDCKIVNITWINRNPAPYYENIKNVPQVATGLYYNDEWYWFSCYSGDVAEYKCLADADRMDKDVEVVAWLPMPEPYEGDDE